VNSMTRTPARGNPCRPAIALPLLKTCLPLAARRGRGLRGESIIAHAAPI
jgi:hypothetical protein